MKKNTCCIKDSKSMYVPMKLTFKEWWQWKVEGRRFVVNLRSLEIHDLGNKKKNCMHHLMADKHRVYASTTTIVSLLDGAWNGCRFCMKREDRG